MMSDSLRIVFVLAIVIGMASSAAAITTITSVDMVANFDDGNTNSGEDGYQGTAGLGWDGAWQKASSGIAGEPYTNVLVRTSGELPGTYDDDYEELTSGTGNYLYVDANVSAANGWLTIARNCSGKLGIDQTLPYTVEFLYRVEEDAMASHFTESKDYYHIYDRGGLSGGGFSDSGWVICAPGNGDGNWVFYDGQGRTGSTGNVSVNTGVGLVVDHVYKFEVAVDPVAKSWDGKVTDLNTTGTFSQTNLGWRIDTTQATGDPDATLSGTIQFAARGDAGNDERQFSVDSMRIQQTRTITIGGMSEVAARFNDGETTEAVDGYAGKAGNGWNSAWGELVSHATLNTAVKDNFSGKELHTDTGNYLEVSVPTDPGSSSYGFGGVYRDYTRADEPGIDWTKEHTIEFTVRIDEDMTVFQKTFTDGNDQYQIFDSPYGRGGRTGDTTWGIYVNGDGDCEWQFANGNGNAADSDIALELDGVYDFAITVDPQTHTYDVFLSDGEHTFEQTGLGWRSATDAVGGTLCFMGRGNNTDDTRAWSIDEIVISQASDPVPGDTDHDGDVDAADAAVLADHWGMTNVTGGADQGDFNGDKAVNMLDASILAANWTGTTEGNSVPEPGALALVTIGVLVLATRRRNRLA